MEQHETHSLTDEPEPIVTDPLHLTDGTAAHSTGISLSRRARRHPCQSLGTATMAMATSLVMLLAGAAPATAHQRSSSSDGHRHGQAYQSPSEQRGKLAMSGDVGDYVEGVVDDPAHDPTLFRADGDWWVYSTGAADPENPGGIYARRSTDGLDGPWESVGAIALPEWTRAYGVAHLWAPQVVRREGVYYLYYAASSFGTNQSGIGLATTRTPADLSSWVDQGPILTSAPTDDFNAIDPYVYEADGRWWIGYGSFWSGLKVRELADMATPTGPVTDLASNAVDPPNAIENPAVFQHEGSWYLTASVGQCCQGVDSTYQTVVGRSNSPTGPFAGRDGKPMTEGATTVLLSRRGDQVGTGAMDVARVGHGSHERLYAVHHYYDAATGGTIRMQVREVQWTQDGWPYFVYGDGDGTPDGRQLQASS